MHFELEPFLMSYGWILAIALVIFVFVVKSIITVQQQTKAIVERFGKFTHVASPGISLIIPFIDKIAHRVDLRVQQLNTEVETKTRDNVFVQMVVSIQFFVENTNEAVFNSFYKLSQPEQQIRSYIFDVVRAEVPKMDLDTVFESKEDIAIAILKSLQEIMGDYGFRISQALITDIAPDAKVKESMNRINAAKRDKEAAEFEGEASRVRMVAQAKAEAESKKLQVEGTADQRVAIAKGISDSVAMLKQHGVDPSEASGILLAVQYMDTLHNIAGRANSNVIMMPLSGVGGLEMTQQIIAGVQASAKLASDGQANKNPA